MINRYFKRSWDSSALLSLCVFAGRAAAQEYEQQTLGKTSPARQFALGRMMANTNESKAVVDMLSGNNASVDTAAFDKFFNTMVFPLFTQWQDVKVPGGKTYFAALDR